MTLEEIIEEKIKEMESNDLDEMIWLATVVAKQYAEQKVAEFKASIDKD